MYGVCRFRREVTVAKGMMSTFSDFKKKGTIQTVNFLQQQLPGVPMGSNQRLTRDKLRRLRKELVAKIGEKHIADVNVLVPHDFRKTFVRFGSKCSLR